MTPEQRQRLIDEFPKQVGNTDGVPWAMRIAANRTNIAQAIADELRERKPGSQGRVAFYQGLLARGGRPGPNRPPGGSPDSGVRPRPGIADRAQRQPGHRQERRRHGPRSEHHDRGFGARTPRRRGDSCPPLAARSRQSPIWVGRSRAATTSRRARRRGRPALRAGHGAAPGGVQRRRRPHRRRHRPRHPRHLYRPLLWRFHHGHRRGFRPDRRPHALPGGRGSRCRRRRSVRLAQPQPRCAAILDDCARRLHRSCARLSDQPAWRRPRRYAGRDPFADR